jgi:hypothetical protein
MPVPIRSTTVSLPEEQVYNRKTCSSGRLTAGPPGPSLHGTAEHGTTRKPDGGLAFPIGRRLGDTPCWRSPALPFRRFLETRTRPFPFTPPSRLDGRPPRLSTAPPATRTADAKARRNAGQAVTGASRPSDRRSAVWPQPRIGERPVNRIRTSRKRRTDGEGSRSSHAEGNK